jgi:hypothetical protein
MNDESPASGTTRYLCPLECGWRHDVPPPTLNRIAELGAIADPAARDLREAIGSVATQALLREAEQTEAALREHLDTHTTAQFARVIHDLRVEVAALRERPASAETETP